MVRNKYDLGITQGFDPVLNRVLSVKPSNLVRAYVLGERSGTVAKDSSDNAGDGTYISVTLNGTRFLDGQPSPTFDGINDAVDIQSDLADDFPNADRDNGTIMAWAKVSGSGVWTDGERRKVIELETDSENNIRIEKNPTDNRLRSFIETQGAVKAQNVDGLTTTDWFCVVIRWDLTLGATDYFEVFIDGVSQGSDVGSQGGWAGGATLIGSIGSNADTTGNHWDGYISDVAIWNTALSDDEIRFISRI